MNCQQDALYAAERGIPSGRDLPTREECQEFVDAMRDTAVWQRQYSNVKRVEVRFRSRGGCSVGGWFANDDAGVVEMLPVHRNELVLCHEVAHVLAAARYGSHAHDPWFARTYLELVYEMMGHEAYEALREAFERDSIDHDHDSAIPAGIEMGG